MYQPAGPLATPRQSARNSLSVDANAAQRPLLHFRNIDIEQLLTI